MSRNNSEWIRPRESNSKVLIVGAGPAGLEAARAVGRRGYQVMLAEASDTFGGRVTRESALPGLSAWARVRDYRLGQISQIPNVETYLASRMTADDIFDVGATHVALATGATWRKDGVGYSIRKPVQGWDQAHVLSPDELMNGERPPEGPVLIFDDDGYYMGSVLADLLVGEGRHVIFATPAATIAEWSEYTLEQGAIEDRLADNGVTLLPRHNLGRIGTDHAELYDGLNRRARCVDCAGVVVVTARLPNDSLWVELEQRRDELAKAGASVYRIGDCFGAGPIASAVYMGHRFAQELDTDVDSDGVPFLRERHIIEA